jgi:hypothetical protein
MDFWSGWRVLAQKMGALANFGDFCGVLGGFRAVLDQYVNIFQKPRTLLEFLQMSGGHSEIYNKFRGLSVNLQGFKNSRFFLQRKNLWTEFTVDRATARTIVRCTGHCRSPEHINEGWRGRG